MGLEDYRKTQDFKMKIISKWKITQNEGSITIEFNVKMKTTINEDNLNKKGKRKNRDKNGLS